MKEQDNFIIYNTEYGKVNVALYTQDGDVWLNQNQLVRLPNSFYLLPEHIINPIIKKIKETKWHKFLRFIKRYI